MCIILLSHFEIQGLQTTSGSESVEAEKDATKSSGKYTQFWNAFGKPMKLGLIEDSSNRQRIAKLLRFTSSKSPTKLTSLSEYIERMKDSQKKIYYIIGKPICPFRWSESL